jgi:hypothetical protein
MAGWPGGSLCIGGVVVGLRLGTELMYTKYLGLILKMARGWLPLGQSVDLVLLWACEVGGRVVVGEMAGG